jgi:hypothetical protein
LLCSALQAASAQNHSTGLNATVVQNAHKDDTDVSSRSTRNHARRHLDSTTVHLYADETLDLAGAGLNGWQQKQRMGVQVIDVSPGA